MRRHSQGVAVIALAAVAWTLAPTARAQDQSPPAADTPTAPGTDMPTTAVPFPSPAAPPPAAPAPAPAAPPPAAVPAAPPAPTGNPPATVLPKDETQGVLGKEVRSSAGESMGQIINVIVDKAGQPRAAVIDFGGFLGMGSRKIAVDWAALHFAPGQPPGPITLDLTRNELKAAPEYKEGQPVVILSASGSTQPMSIDTPEQPEH